MVTRENGMTDDLIIGTAVEALLEDGDEQAAVLLLDVLDWRPIYPGEGSWVTVVLSAPRWQHDRFTPEIRDRILKAIQDPAAVEGLWVTEIQLEAPLAQPGWRERAEERLRQGPSNQAVIGPPPRTWPTEDRLRFRDAGELAVYRALKRAQAALPPHESLTILPNPGARTRAESTWEPDFVVAYKNRVGIIQVDGSTHQGRAAADKTKDRFFEDCGIAYVDRWVVEDTTDDAVLDDLVERFLGRLASY
jgi:hypothetical protein